MKVFSLQFVRWFLGCFWLFFREAVDVANKKPGCSREKSWGQTRTQEETWKPCSRELLYFCHWTMMGGMAADNDLGTQGTKMNVGIRGSLPCQVSLPYQNPWPHLVWPVRLLCRHFDMENSWKFQVMPNKPATELQFSYSKIVHRNRRRFPNLHVPVTCETRKWSNSFAFLIWILTNPPANPRLVFFIVDIYQKANISWKTNP